MLLINSVVTIQDTAAALFYKRLFETDATAEVQPLTLLLLSPCIIAHIIDHDHNDVDIIALIRACSS